MLVLNSQIVDTGLVGQECLPVSAKELCLLFSLVSPFGLLPEGTVKLRNPNYFHLLLVLLPEKQVPFNAIAESLLAILIVLIGLELIDQIVHMLVEFCHYVVAIYTEEASCRTFWWFGGVAPRTCLTKSQEPQLQRETNFAPAQCKIQRSHCDSENAKSKSSLC